MFRMDFHNCLIEWEECIIESALGAGFVLGRVVLFSNSHYQLIFDPFILFQKDSTGTGLLFTRIGWVLEFPNNSTNK